MYAFLFSACKEVDKNCPFAIFLGSARYELTEQPAKGQVEFLCGGVEVYNADTCSTESQNDEAEPQVFYKYVPSTDAEGEDDFKFELRLEGQSSLAPKPGAVALNVQKVNQAPQSFDAEVELPLNYPVGPHASGGFAQITLKAEDSDSSILLGLVDMQQFWTGAGQLYMDIGDGPEGTGTPIRTTMIDDVLWGEVQESLFIPSQLLLTVCCENMQNHISCCLW